MKDSKRRRRVDPSEALLRALSRVSRLRAPQHPDGDILSMESVSASNAAPSALHKVRLTPIAAALTRSLIAPPSDDELGAVAQLLQNVLQTHKKLALVSTAEELEMGAATTTTTGGGGVVGVLDLRGCGITVAMLSLVTETLLQCPLIHSLDLRDNATSWSSFDNAIPLLTLLVHHLRQNRFLRSVLLDDVCGGGQDASTGESKTTDDAFHSAADAGILRRNRRAQRDVANIHAQLTALCAEHEDDHRRAIAKLERQKASEKAARLQREVAEETAALHRLEGRERHQIASTAFSILHGVFDDERKAHAALAAATRKKNIFLAQQRDIALFADAESSARHRVEAQGNAELGLLVSADYALRRRSMETVEGAERIALKKAETSDWVETRRREKKRFAEERCARESLQEDEVEARRALLGVVAAADAELTAQIMHSHEEAKQAEVARLDRQRREEQARKRAEDQARERAEKEEAQRQKAIREFLLKQQNVREKMDSDASLVRKSIRNLESAMSAAIFRLAALWLGVCQARADLEKAAAAYCRLLDEPLVLQVTLPAPCSAEEGKEPIADIDAPSNHPHVFITGCSSEWLHVVAPTNFESLTLNAARTPSLFMPRPSATAAPAQGSSTTPPPTPNTKPQQQLSTPQRAKSIALEEPLVLGGGSGAPAASLVSLDTRDGWMTLAKTAQQEFRSKLTKYESTKAAARQKLTEELRSLKAACVQHRAEYHRWKLLLVFESQQPSSAASPKSASHQARAFPVVDSSTAESAVAPTQPLQASADDVAILDVESFAAGAAYIAEICNFGSQHAFLLEWIPRQLEQEGDLRAFATQSMVDACQKAGGSLSGVTALPIGKELGVAALRSLKLRINQVYLRCEVSRQAETNEGEGRQPFTCRLHWDTSSEGGSAWESNHAGQQWSVTGSDAESPKGNGLSGAVINPFVDIPDSSGNEGHNTADGLAASFGTLPLSRPSSSAPSHIDIRVPPLASHPPHATAHPRSLVAATGKPSALSAWWQACVKELYHAALRTPVGSSLAAPSPVGQTGACLVDACCAWVRQRRAELEAAPPDAQQQQLTTAAAAGVDVNDYYATLSAWTDVLHALEQVDRSSLSDLGGFSADPSSTIDVSRVFQILEFACRGASDVPTSSTSAWVALKFDVAGAVTPPDTSLGGQPQEPSGTAPTAVEESSLATTVTATTPTDASEAFGTKVLLATADHYQTQWQHVMDVISSALRSLRFHASNTTMAAVGAAGGDDSLDALHLVRVSLQTRCTTDWAPFTSAFHILRSLRQLQPSQQPSHNFECCCDVKRSIPVYVAAPRSFTHFSRCKSLSELADRLRCAVLTRADQPPTIAAMTAPVGHHVQHHHHGSTVGPITLFQADDIADVIVPPPKLLLTMATQNHSSHQHALHHHYDGVQQVPVSLFAGFELCVSLQPRSHVSSHLAGYEPILSFFCDDCMWVGPAGRAAGGASPSSLGHIYVSHRHPVIAQHITGSSDNASLLPSGDIPVCEITLGSIAPCGTPPPHAIAVSASVVGAMRKLSRKASSTMTARKSLGGGSGSAANTARLQDTSGIAASVGTHRGVSHIVLVLRIEHFAAISVELLREIVMRLRMAAGPAVAVVPTAAATGPAVPPSPAARNIATPPSAQPSPRFPASDGHHPHHAVIGVASSTLYDVDVFLRPSVSSHHASNSLPPMSARGGDDSASRQHSNATTPRDSIASVAHDLMLAVSTPRHHTQHAMVVHVSLPNCPRLLHMYGAVPMASRSVELLPSCLPPPTASPPTNTPPPTPSSASLAASAVPSAASPVIPLASRVRDWLATYKPAAPPIAACIASPGGIPSVLYSAVKSVSNPTAINLQFAQRSSTGLLGGAFDSEPSMHTIHHETAFLCLPMWSSLALRVVFADDASPLELGLLWVVRLSALATSGTNIDGPAAASMTTSTPMITSRQPVGDSSGNSVPLPPTAAWRVRLTGSIHESGLFSTSSVATLSSESEHDGVAGSSPEGTADVRTLRPHRIVKVSMPLLLKSVFGASNTKAEEMEHPSDTTAPPLTPPPQDAVPIAVIWLRCPTNCGTVESEATHTAPLQDPPVGSDQVEIRFCFRHLHDVLKQSLLPNTPLTKSPQALGLMLRHVVPMLIEGTLRRVQAIIPAPSPPPPPPQSSVTASPLAEGDDHNDNSNRATMDGDGGENTTTLVATMQEAVEVDSSMWCTIEADVSAQLSEVDIARCAAAAAASASTATKGGKKAGGGAKGSAAPTHHSAAPTATCADMDDNAFVAITIPIATNQLVPLELTANGPVTLAHLHCNSSSRSSSSGSDSAGHRSLTMTRSDWVVAIRGCNDAGVVPPSACSPAWMTNPVTKRVAGVRCTTSGIAVVTSERSDDDVT